VIALIAVRLRLDHIAGPKVFNGLAARWREKQRPGHEAENGPVELIRRDLVRHSTSSYLVIEDASLLSLVE
jgi:hypothetical protein